jgi:hypothetical protein
MKRMKLVFLLCSVVLTVALTGSASVQLPDDEVERGFAISPVPVNLVGKDRTLVGLGSYIVNTGGCNDCHTNPSYVEGYDPFLGQPEWINATNFLAGGQEFGPFKSRNITPDVKTGRPAGLTLAQFFDAMRNGTDHEMLHPQFGPLLQVMPWPVFGKKTDRELRAVYEYLSAIPHAEPRP